MAAAGDLSPSKLVGTVELPALEGFNDADLRVAVGRTLTPMILADREQLMNERRLLAFHNTRLVFALNELQGGGDILAALSRADQWTGDARQAQLDHTDKLVSQCSFYIESVRAQAAALRDERDSVNREVQALRAALERSQELVRLKDVEVGRLTADVHQIQPVLDEVVSLRKSQAELRQRVQLLQSSDPVVRFINRSGTPPAAQSLPSSVAHSAGPTPSEEHLVPLAGHARTGSGHQLPGMLANASSSSLASPSAVAAAASPVSGSAPHSPLGGGHGALAASVGLHRVMAAEEAARVALVADNMLYHDLVALVRDTEYAVAAATNDAMASAQEIDSLQRDLAAAKRHNDHLKRELSRADAEVDAMKAAAERQRRAMWDSTLARLQRVMHDMTDEVQQRLNAAYDEGMRDGVASTRANSRATSSRRSARYSAAPSVTGYSVTGSVS